MNNDDAIWFKQRTLRNARIRPPASGEFGQAWLMLGDHQVSRRRVLVWRVPANNPGRQLIQDGLMRIPMLQRADETIEDSDDVLLPMLDHMMKVAAGAPKDAIGAISVSPGVYPEPAGHAPDFPGYVDNPAERSAFDLYEDD